MKHVFYVIYVLFYTGAVFITGLFVGQMLERSWEARRTSSQKMSRAEREDLTRILACPPPSCRRRVCSRIVGLEYVTLLSWYSRHE
jgi:hypothetical protein